MLTSIKSLSVADYIFFLLVVLGIVVLRFVYKILTDPLRDVPGPFLARFTRLWELQQLRKGHFERVNIDLHKQHGAQTIHIALQRTSCGATD